jgi:predicted transcriptional regulator
MDSVPTPRLRDKRPQYLRVFDPEYHHFGTIPKNVRAYAMAVYICIAHHANGRTDTAFPSYATICNHTGLSRPTAAKAVEALMVAGLIDVQTRVNKGERIANLYTLLSVVVNDVDNQDVVVKETDNLLNVVANLVSDVDRVVSDVDRNQTNEPNQEPEEMKKEVSPVVLRIRERDAKRLAKR